MKLFYYTHVYVAIFMIFFNYKHFTQNYSYFVCVCVYVHTHTHTHMHIQPQIFFICMPLSYNT